MGVALRLIEFCIERSLQIAVDEVLGSSSQSMQSPVGQFEVLGEVDFP